MKKAIIGLIVLFGILAVVAFGIYKINKTFTLAMHSPRIVPDKKPESVNELNVPFEDGTIRAWVVNSPQESADIAVIFAPGYQGSKAFLMPLAEYFSSQGFLGVVFDPRGEGESDGEVYALGAFEDEDMEIIMNWIEKNYNIHQFVLFGFSAGATASIIAASRNQSRVIATIADSPFANLFVAQGRGLLNVLWARLCNFWGRLRTGMDLFQETNALSVIDKVSGIFIIHGKEDKTIDFSNAQMLYDAAQNPKELWLVEGADHVQAVQFHREEYLARTLRFIVKVMSQKGRF